MTGLTKLGSSARAKHASPAATVASAKGTPRRWQAVAAVGALALPTVFYAHQALAAGEHDTFAARSITVPAEVTSPFAEFLAPHIVLPLTGEVHLATTGPAPNSAPTTEAPAPATTNEPSVGAPEASLPEAAPTRTLSMPTVPTAAPTADPVADDPVVEAAPANDTAEIRPGQAVVVVGRAWGHGRGLSQYGARGAAELGIGHEEILDFYYPGTEMGTLTDGVIAVWLEADDDNDLTVAAAPGLLIQDANGAVFTLDHPEGTATQWRITREDDGSAMLIAGLVDDEWRYADTGTPLAAPVTIYSPEDVLTLVKPDGTQVTYRGELKAVPDRTAAGLRTVNVLYLEDYLRSVVPAEMPDEWPAEALKAQAIAARSYAAFAVDAYRDNPWHTCDSSKCQSYQGVRTETPVTDAAVAATSGLVRVYQGELAFTQFGASNGGWTSAGDRPYLVAQEDPWDGLHNEHSPWAASVSPAQIAAQYPQVGTPVGVEVLARSGTGEFGGRVQRVRIVGTAGSVEVTGDQFKTAFGLRSNWWTLVDPDDPAAALVDTTQVLGPLSLSLTTTDVKDLWGLGR